MLPLMGGLGNQLFQLQAALAVFDGDIELMGNIGNPRTSEGIPDICHGTLPSRVIYNDASPNKLIHKVHSMVLRTFLTSSSPKAARLLVKYFSSIVFSMYLKRIVRVVASTDLGFCPLEKIKGNTVLIGYFQSFHWKSEELTSLFSNIKPSYLNDLKSVADTKSICILHIRLTDYLKEKNFGLLDSTYYEAALDILNNQTTIDEIWLFSDDLDSAGDVVPEKYKKVVKVINDEGLLPIEVLHLMSIGSSYVIANSTFSWWAAKLSNSRQVIAPEPWFVGAKEPSQLIPDEWLRLNRNVN